MKKVKFIIIAIIFFVTNDSWAQQFSFKTSSLTVLEKNARGEWGKWSKPEAQKLIIRLDYDHDKIVVYSNIIQYYKIVEYLPKEVTEKDEINSYLCKNLDGYALKVSIILRKDQGNKAQLYVYQDNLIFCYDIEENID